MYRILGAGLLTLGLTISPASSWGHGHPAAGHAGGGHHFAPPHIPSGGQHHFVPPHVPGGSQVHVPGGGQHHWGTGGQGVGTMPRPGAGVSTAAYIPNASSSPSVLKIGAHAGSQGASAFGKGGLTGGPLPGTSSATAGSQTATVVGAHGPVIINQQQSFTTYTIGKHPGQRPGGSQGGMTSTAQVGSSGSGGMSGYGGTGGANGVMGSSGMNAGPAYAGNNGAPSPSVAGYGTGPAFLTSGVTALQMTPAQAALQSAHQQIQHFVGQVQQLGVGNESTSALEHDLEQMKAADQPPARLQALRSAMTNLTNLGQSPAFPAEGRGYLAGLQERLQELAQVAGEQVAQQ